MKERPLLFSAPMVRAVLHGSKTQTRRVVKNGIASGRSEAFQKTQAFQDDLVPYCPYGKPGDRLWVRETHRPIFGQTCGLIAVDYRADPSEKWERLGDQIGAPVKWIPSIHMRREYSRILLEIVSVRVERLSDCSDADARAEGATGGHGVCPSYNYNATPSEHFSHIWESINGTGSWADNPWVWVVEFKRVTP